MKALIISAGEGSRFREQGGRTPKQLNSLLGLTLLERVILLARKAGIREFVIVTGCEAQKIKTALGNGEKYEVKIEYVHNPEWQKGNGSSVLKAKRFFANEESFVLLMSDHIWEPRILKELLDNRKGCSLCIDKKIFQVNDVEDATKLLVSNGKVEAIGKNLRRYNAIDCGIFLCTPAIFTALEESDTSKKIFLSDGMRALAKKGMLKIFDIGEHFWVDIDTPQILRKVERSLCKSSGKSGDGLISRKLNRFFSQKLTYLLARTKITPNLVTLLSFVVGISSGVLFWFHSYLLAGLTAQFASIIDGVDGEIARLKLMETRFGAYFDAILDRYADAFIILGMTYSQFKVHSSPWIWVVGIGAIVGSFMSMLGKEKYKALTGRQLIVHRDEGLLRYLPFVLQGRDVRLFIVMWGGILNLVYPAILLLALITNLNAGLRLWGVRKSLKH